MLLTAGFSEDKVYSVAQAGLQLQLLAHTCESEAEPAWATRGELTSKSNLP